MDKYNIDLDENARQIQEAKRLEAEKKPTGSRELEILKGLYADAGKPFPSSADPGEIDHDFFMDAAKEARRLYELEMTDEDREAEREQIRKQVQKAKEKGAGALNWAEYLKSRDLWERIQDETQKDIINRAYTQIISELELLSLNLAGIIQYYPQDEKKYRKDLKEFDRCRAVIKDAFYSLPFFIAEYSKPQYGGKCPADLYEDAEKDENGKPAESSLYFQAERAAMREYLARYFSGSEKKSATERVNVKKADSIYYPTDIVSNNVFNYGFEGNIKDKFKLSAAGKKKEAFVFFGADFSSLSESEAHKLTHYHKKICIVAKSLFDAGNKTITASQIYGLMRTGNAGTADILRIDNAMRLMGTVDIYVLVDRESAENYKTLKDKGVKGINTTRGKLIYFTTEPAVVNGKWADFAYNFFIPADEKKGKSPFPLLELSEALEQYTDIPPEALKIPVSMTEDNMAIEDYLLQNINREKRGKGAKDKDFYLLIINMFDTLGIMQSGQRSKKTKTAEQILDHYKKIGFIKNFSLKDGKIYIKI